MKEKKCVDCAFFKEFYVKKKLRFYNTGQGICTSEYKNGQSRKPVKACEAFEYKDIHAENEERQKAVLERLSVIITRLNDLYEVLDNENSNDLD